MKEKEIDREGKQAKDSQQTDKEIPISVSLPLSFNSLSTVYSLVLYPGQYVYTIYSFVLVSLFIKILYFLTDRRRL